MDNGYLAGAICGLIAAYVLAVGIHGLGNTLVRLALALYTIGTAIQGEQDTYGRKLRGRWVRVLEGVPETEPSHAPNTPREPQI